MKEKHNFPADVILSPVITEDAMARIADKRYTFMVAPEATKPQIARAVEAAFKGAKVKKVNTMHVKGKPRRVGYHIGKTARRKKAIVTLTEDSKPIEFFEGMS